MSSPPMTTAPKATTDAVDAAPTTTTTTAASSSSSSSSPSTSSTNGIHSNVNQVSGPQNSANAPASATRRPSHPALDAFRRHSSLHYQSFPSFRTRKVSGKPVKRRMGSANDNIGAPHGNEPTATNAAPDSKASLSRRKSKQQKMAPTPVPTKKLLVLAFIALAEQTAFNSISPYLPEMVGLFPEVEPENVGVSVGTIASAFAVAQFVTNFFWGHLSDRIGRKPVILCGTLLTAFAFVLFAFTRTLWEAVMVQALMGMVNGNAGVVSTVLGEITDRSNQSAAFAYLPVVYGIGAILGPILGGLLASSRESRFELVRRFPYCLPNLASAALLFLDFALCVFFLDESLAEAKNLPPISQRIRNIFAWLWQFTSSARPSYSRRRYLDVAETSQIEPLLGENCEQSGRGGDSSESDSDDSDFPGLFSSSKPVPWKQILTPSTIILLITYFIFNLSLVGYNSLYPIFVSSPPPTGRATPVRDIGLSLAFAGGVTIAFQVLFFAKLQDKAGNELSFKGSLGLFALTFLLSPFIGYEDKIGKVWLWTELAIVLALKVVSSITALTCAMILITNCAPNTSSLGSINGLAQTLSAGGRAFGPFAAGGLFTIGTRHHRGEWIPWGVFGGIAMIGFFVSFGLGRKPEKREMAHLESNGQMAIAQDVEAAPS